MRIKLFENFNGESLYKDITSDDWGSEKEFMEKMVDISIPIANQILNNIDTKEFKVQRLPESRIDYSTKKIVFSSYMTIKLRDALPWSDNYIKLEIWEDYDEYFWVKMETAGEDLFFRCDQIDGLLELLKEYNITK